MAVETIDLGQVDPPIEKVEFKYTLLTVDEPKVRHLLDAGRGRKVYFYDTRDLALADRGLVLRFRTTEGEKDNSTVKLRPAPLDDEDAAWRAIDGIEVEGDLVGRELNVSAKLDEKITAGKLKPSASAALFAEQQALVDAYAADVDPDTVVMLGRVDARKWQLEIDSIELDVEEWDVLGALRFLELSFKVDREQAPAATQDFRALLQRLKLNPDAPQETKTKQVLRLFAARLRAA